MHRLLPLLPLLALALPLTAQTTFRTTRHAGLPPGITASTIGIDPGDVDGDGDLDLVVSRGTSSLVLLLNDGNGRFTDATVGRLVSPAQLDCPGCDLVDIDGDGDLDLLAINQNQLPNLVYRNDGTGVFTDVSATALPANAFDSKNQVIADFDGDGDVDWLSVDLGGSHVYANNGAGVFTDVTTTRLVGLSPLLGNPWVPAPAAADLDGDGDLDVVVPGAGGFAGPGAILLNQNGVLTATTLLPPTAGAPHWLADVDGDGDVDLFSGAGTRLWQNQGNATFVETTAAAFPVTAWNTRACFDVDRDGDVDTLATNGIWLNDGNGLFALQPMTLSLPSQLFARAAADYDGDGDLELPGLPNHLHHVSAVAAPARGATWAVTLDTRPGVPALAAVFGALGAGSTPLGAFGTLRLDPASVQILGVQFATAPPTTVAVAVPNVPALAGLPVHIQAIVDDPIVGLVTTNTFRDLVQ